MPDPRWGPAPPGWRFWASDDPVEDVRRSPSPLWRPAQGGRFAYIVALVLALMTGIAAVAKELVPGLPRGIWLTAALIGLTAGVLSAVLDLHALKREARGGSATSAALARRSATVRGGWLAASAIFTVASFSLPFFLPLALFGLLMALNRRKAAAGAAVAIFLVLLISVVGFVVIIAISALSGGYGY